MPTMAEWHAKNRTRFIDRAEVPTRLRKRLSDLEIDVEVYAHVEDMVTRVATTGEPLGRGLMLCGDPGRGKTTIAVAALIEVLETAPYEVLGKTPYSYPMLPGFYITYARLIRKHKESWDGGDEADAAKDLIRSLYGEQTSDHWNTRVLVLDDVGKEHGGASGFTVNTLHDLLRSRYDLAFPTIVTTNLKPQDWAREYGDAMGSFIREAFDIVHVGGEDRR